MKAAHEDLAQLQKSLQTAQDLAKDFQELEQAKERYRLEIEEGLKDRQRQKCIWRNYSLLQGLQGNHSDLEAVSETVDAIRAGP